MTRFIEKDGGLSVVCDCGNDCKWEMLAGKAKTREPNRFKFINAYFAVCPFCEIIFTAKDNWFHFSPELTDLFFH